MDAQLFAELRTTFGNIYEAQVKDQVFYFRELRRGEFDYLEEAYKEGLDVAICNVAVVYPQEYDFEVRGRAGIPPVLADEILYASGLANTQQLHVMLAEKRKQMNKFEKQAEVFISQAFKNVTFEEMKSWTQEQLMDMLAKAEFALNQIWQLPVEFREAEAEEGEEEVKQPTLKEIGDEIREQGGDPMIILGEELRANHKRNRPFIDFPLIGGPRLLEKEEVLGDVRKQVSRLPHR